MTNNERHYRVLKVPKIEIFSKNKEDILKGLASYNRDYHNDDNWIEVIVGKFVLQVSVDNDSAYRLEYDEEPYLIYCSPNAFRPHITDYATVEISICVLEGFYDENPICDRIIPYKDSRFRGAHWATYFDEFTGKYISIDILCEIIKDCLRISELLVFD